MFILSKGYPKTVNLIKDRENKFVGTVGGNKRGGLCNESNTEHGLMCGDLPMEETIVQRTELPLNIRLFFLKAWPKIILFSWSNEGDLIYDPFMGSGTTAKMAIKNKRQWIGSEVSVEYCKIAEKRLEEFSLQTTIFD